MSHGAFAKGSRALVTGASGFIGSELVRTLNSHQIEVVTLLRKTSSVANLEGAKFTRVEGDLSDLESLKRAVDGVDYVFHLAGAIAAPNKSTFFKHNAEGTERLAQAVKESGRTLRRFVFVSSIAAGGPSGGVNPRKEIDPEQPVSAYGQSKYEAEVRLAKYKQVFPISVVRPPIVYGPKDRAMLVLFKTVSRNFMPMVKGKTPSGDKYYSAIFIDDLCDLIYRAGVIAAEKNLPSGEVFYGCDGRVYSYREILEQIALSMGKRTIKLKLPIGLVRKVAGISDWAGSKFNFQAMLTIDKLNEIIPDYWTCDFEKAQSLLGFEPKFQIEEGVKRTTKWYRDHKWI